MVSGYIEIIEDTLLAFRLPAFEGRMRGRERRHPKLYWIDAGLVRALKRHLGPPTPEELGPLFEGWVANLLRTHNDYAELFDECFYWAPAEAARTEVDFLLRRGREWIAMEAKAGPRAGPDELRGLRAIHDMKGLARRILVFRGPRRLRTSDGIDVWPVAALIEALSTNKLWP